MCGIFGVITSLRERLTLDRARIEHLRDLMFHRGPDGAGLWTAPHAALAHRRLAVLDPSPQAAQPMVSPDERAIIVYNGELYNDLELREQLASDAAPFRTHSDTETVLRALQRWGPKGLRQLRGMYALAFLDLDRDTLLLARDPLGIKPLYLTRRLIAGHAEIAFSSEIRPLLELGWHSAQPDLPTLSAYFTTIRTTLGHRTLYRDIFTLLPGEQVLIDLSQPMLPARRSFLEPHDVARVFPTNDHDDELGLDSGNDPLGLTGASASSAPTALATAPTQSLVAQCRSLLEDSVRRHLRCDVPTCVLLSGGLDSTLIAAIARAESTHASRQLRTYCSGALRPDGTPTDDFCFARLASEALGSSHCEAPVTRDLFARRWPEIIAATRVPLSTPNEVAINEVARRLRADGCVVALSGEGADELLGGYDLVLTAAHRHVLNGNADPAFFHLRENAWIPLDAKQALLHEDAWNHAEHDDILLDTYRSEFSLLSQQHDDTPLQVHLRFHRRINLAGLLLRLDSAMMLAGVEGRTPFADTVLARFAEALPMSMKFDPGANHHRGKLILRRAFADTIPREILERPKASFPLPFQEWCADAADMLRQSSFLRSIAKPDTLSAIAADPITHWRFAWPLINVAIWSRDWN